MLHDQPIDKQAQPEKIMTITQLHDDPHYPLVMPPLPVLYLRFMNIDRITGSAAIRPVSKPDQARIRKELR